MTRTERATSPRAILKDRYVTHNITITHVSYSLHISSVFSATINKLLRSESKSGYDKSLRKGGAGPHNWGAVREELELERDALEDNEFETEELDVADQPNAAIRPSVDGPIENGTLPNGAANEDEVEKAREYRAKGLKGDGAFIL